MTRRRTGWLLDVALTWVLALVVALSAGRIVVWIEWLQRVPDSGDRWWVLVAVAGACLAITLIAVARTSPATADAYAHGVDHGHLAIGPAPVRFVALVSGVGTGAPLGHEGPMVYFGASLGAAAARRLRRPERWFVLAAATAAVAMVIGAPIAAALFASEVAQRGLPRRGDRMPLALGAFAAWIARRLTGEAGGLLGVDPDFAARQVVVGALVIGVVAAIVGRVFVRAIRTAKGVHPPLRTRLVLVVVLLGSALAGGWATTGEPIFLGSGDRLRDWAAGASQPALLVAAAVFAALVVAMIACGLVGGLFLPLLSLGAATGVLVGRAWLPDVPFAACTVIGACTLLAAAYGTPFTAGAIAFATFGWSASSWLVVAGVVLAAAAAGDRSVSMYQLPAGTGRHRRAAVGRSGRATWWARRREPLRR